jgi:hypothetical protein
MPAKKAEGQDHDAATGSWIESDDEMGSDEMGTPKIQVFPTLSRVVPRQSSRWIGAILSI